MIESTTRYLRDNKKKDAQGIMSIYRGLTKSSPPVDEAIQEKSLRDMIIHIDYLCEAIDASSLPMWHYYIQWCTTLFEALSLKDEWLNILIAGQIYYRQTLPEYALDCVSPYLETLTPFLSQSASVQAHVLSNDSKMVLDWLITGQKNEVLKYTQNRVKTHEDIKYLYAKIFQPVLAEVGRLWQVKQLSVAQEHYSTAVIQLAMSQLYPIIFTREPNNHKVITACVGSELHELGIRMVSDYLEMAGWDSHYLGSNVPHADLISAITEINPDCVMISCTLYNTLSRLKTTINTIKNAFPDLPVLVGGAPFNIDPSLVYYVKADAMSTSGDHAVEVISKYMVKE